MDHSNTQTMGRPGSTPTDEPNPAWSSGGGPSWFERGPFHYAMICDNGDDRVEDAPETPFRLEREE